MKRVFVLAALAVAFAVPSASAKTHTDCHSRSCVMRVANKQCSQKNVHACILLAALTHHVSHHLLSEIARCESGFNPYSYNKSGASGLMQFMIGTFRGTPYGHHSPFYARWSALAGAWLLHRSGTKPWVSSQGCWG